MRGRDPREPHRASTPLELLFDLCFVVAVARAGAALEAQVEAGHTGLGVVGYLAAFFAIWWAWMNFTWFASAFDTDDVPYRLTVLVQIGGSLVLAAGIRDLVVDADSTVATWGYVVMRVAMVVQWLRAARSDPAHRGTAARYAAGVLAVQVGWLVRLSLPHDWWLWTFGVLVVVELAVPAWAERRIRTTYHPRHVSERYGLFTVIVLGEAVTAAAGAVESAVDQDGHRAELTVVAVSGLVVLFAIWWLYFDQPETRRLGSLRTALAWGYGHYAVFSSIAAVGAGLALSVAALSGSGGEEHHLSATTAHAVLTVPVAVFLLAKLALHEHDPAASGERVMAVAIPVTAALVLAVTWTAAAVPVTAVLVAALLALQLAVTRGTRTAAHSGRASRAGRRPAGPAR
ncbi:low temperature requirement protein A [Nakamurella endophytica]|uniref:Low temperature requirement protein A n=1 Tax=Nakamurella endophytica TaxID=1748367 RepID=A0A917WHL7_9ACTN|nr:low temperature requirement protein A [Nakamurella endophytica]GGM07055.1 hypothetical protein GCM10011594_28830 [Nakamurella endophytica]